jgi:UDP-N-acetylglucosamine 2-epimerase (non-hydrolysing)
MHNPVVLVVLGTRPEVIKLAPVVHALRASGDLSVRVCVTAQHRQMLDLMLRSFDLHPDFDLDLMRPNQDLTTLSARALTGLRDVLNRVKPAYVLVQGDTTTAFIAALAAFYAKVPVGHVEAGLRTFDRENPFPEETNRVLISRLTDLHFTPTRAAGENLIAEGVPARSIVMTGNTVVDALRWAGAQPHRVAEPALFAALDSMMGGDKAVLVTTHRRENHGEPLESLCGAFMTLVQRHPELHLFYPVHMNPKVRKVVRRIVRHPRAHLLPTLDYFDLLHVLRLSRFVLTDSGGLQEEAPALGKPVIILRQATERPEGVAAGVAALAGTDARAVVSLASRLMEDGAFYDSMAKGSGIYGDGRASWRIVDRLRRRFGFASRPTRAVRVHEAVTKAQ